MGNPLLIHKGVDHEMEFKGLTPPFLYYMIGLLLGSIFLFLVLKGVGLPVLIALGITVGQLTFLGNRIFRLNRELGKNGLLKKSAFAHVPLGIRIKDRSAILKLRTLKSKR
ncbi:DUF4133 domain-containing protein [Algoriphagus lacus]|uniref:DUF4133 domain-containing protein n=1 Tax=Algoriphagus lacus TaxID=2056311 RepID=A0A418PLD6_9BACT|nr:DUF4133 domain-containing protein [Algoriphagus lacus]RIW12105.1 DUF4133 domain-containing protein [Algoriphagus lacus]